MTGIYTSISDIWPLLATLVFIAALGLYSGWRRSVPGAQLFAISCLFLALWLAGAVAESAAVGLSAKIAWYKFQVVCQLPSVTAMACFPVAYAGAGRWLTRRNVILLFSPSLLLLLLILTNDLHHLMWLSLKYAGSFQPLRGIGGWILLVYGWSLVLVSITVFVWLFIRSPQHRWPVALMIFGQIASRGLYLLDVAELHFVTPSALFILTLLIPFGIYAIALFGFRIFDPLQAARQTVIEQMREGMIVFDTRWQVANLNLAAAGILGVPAAAARGRTVQEILPALPDLGPRLVEAGADPLEISLGTGPETRYYAPDFTPIKDHRGLIAGYLLLLRDVTELHRAQAQALVQQWAQATLQEREQLAHELHDGLSQNLAFLNLQAQAVQVYLQSEQSDAAQASLTRLAEVARQLQGDIRDLIGNLLTVSLPSTGFCSTLRQVLERFQAQNDMVVHLEIEGNADALCGPPLLSPATGVQLVRIVQEALANVRKHAASTSQVSVRLRVAAGQMQLTISDNGAGFDPALPDATGKHFGLQIMRQRAARIGGQIAVHTAPGQGTRVEVCVPLCAMGGAAGEGRSAV